MRSHEIFPSACIDPGFIVHSKDFCKNMEGYSGEENDFCDAAVLAYINQELMEDNSEDKAFMIQDSTLYAAEQSLYELLNEKSPSSANLHLPCEETRSSSDDGIPPYNYYLNSCNSPASGIVSDHHHHKSSCCSIVQHACVEHNFTTNSLSFCPPSCSCDIVDYGMTVSLVNVHSKNQFGWGFKEGIKEYNSSDLPSEDNYKISSFDKNGLAVTNAKEKVLTGETEGEKDEGTLLILGSSLLKVRKSIDHREESDLEEGRSKKHMGVYADESALHEMFDNLLSICDANNEPLDYPLLNVASREYSQQNERAKVSNAENTCTRKGTSKREAIDTRNLLMRCMQFVASSDHQSAYKLLKQIRLHSSPLGDGSQRLSHYFANSLEARLAGAGNLGFKSLPFCSFPVAHVLKACNLYLTAFPFLATGYFFVAQMIRELAEKETSTIHIIHFGIVDGLQWVPLVQLLSTRPGGPPKLRITGIDLPQDGFRPDARVKETGHRLANFCERYNVPFQFKGFAQKWETVSVEDLGIQNGELLVVNSMYLLMYLLDDTVMEHSPRDAVLNIIRRISPDIFFLGVSNGTFNSPFFVSRFREALFHFSVLFDMFEAHVPRENPHRMVFEREIWGREILNIVACEGSERVPRPETYKRWQTRTLRAGFRQLPLNQNIVNKIRAKVKSGYHKDFFIDETSQWLLEGWKGKVIFALSSWKPA